jgi:hypothetical protein
MVAAGSDASPLFLPDDQLLKQCRLDTYRGSGPGGQKRNKTSNAVRLTHLPTKLAVTATESRSLGENKLYALRRLRLKLATHQRHPVDLLHFTPPDWFIPLRHDRALQISHRHPLYAATAGLILDLFQALHGNPAAVAVNLGLSTTALIKFLETEPQFWIAANRIRADLVMPPLTHRR